MTVSTPPAWSRCALGDIGEWGSGGTPSRADPEAFGEGIPWLKIGDLPDGPVHEAEESITLKGLTNSSAKRLEPGTLLVAMYGSIGKLGITTFPCATNQAIAFCKPGAGIDLKYLFYALLNERPRLVALGQGGTQLNISQTLLKAHEVSIAPSGEQQRIVSRMEELLSEIDEGDRALERVQKLVGRYRQSVLSAAVTGELTREWRGDRPFPSGRHLESHISAAHKTHALHAPRAGLQVDRVGDSLRKRMERYEAPSGPQCPAPEWLPKSWAWVTVAHVAECLDYARVPVSSKEREKRPGDVPYFGANGQVGFIDQQLFDEPLVLVVEDETFTGRTKPFSYLITGRSWVNNHAHVLRPTSAIDVRYLNAVLMRYPFIPLTTGTTARRKLTQKSLMAAPVAIPPIEEQQAIIELLEVRLSNATATEHENLAAVPRANALRQAILKAAFSGQLVAQDPSDEPASALLARLAEQATETPATPRRRTPRTRSKAVAA